MTKPDKRRTSIHRRDDSGDNEARAAAQMAFEKIRRIGTGLPIIHQAVLEQFVAIGARIDELQEERASLRAIILAALRQGVPIEAGRLGASFRNAVEHRPTLGELRRIFGDEFVDDLREQLRPTNRTYLTIREHPGES